MNIKFRITEVHEAENLIVVRFYTDVVTEQAVGSRTTYAISLPIPTPTGQALVDFILTKAPVVFLAEREAIWNKAHDFSELKNMVNQENAGFFKYNYSLRQR